MQRWDARQTPPWMWISVGIGSGLLITLVVGLGIRYLRAGQEADPRTRQVEELLVEAERLLAQGKRTTRKGAN